MNFLNGRYCRLAAAFFFLCVTGCGEKISTLESIPPRAIILVSVDSLRPDHLGIYGYHRPTSPFVDEFATRATVFENAVSTSSWTLPSHVSLMISREAAAHGVHTPNERLRAGVDTLARSLRSAGYRTGGFFSCRLLSNSSGLEQGFDHYIQSDLGNKLSQGTAINEAALKWVDSGHEPFFLFLHYYDVHAPYRQRRPGQGVFADPDEGPFGDYLSLTGTVANRFLERHGVDTSGLDWRFPKTGYGRAKQRFEETTDDPELHEDLLQHTLLNRGLTSEEQSRVIDLYDAGVSHMDRLLERLAAGLEERGLFDNALVWIVSDHGEMLYDHHGYRDHTHYLNQAVTAIPMIVRLPNQDEPRRVSRPVVSLIDVMPTILDLAGVDPKGRGVSLRGLLEGTSEVAERALTVQVAFDGSFKRSILRWPWKLIVDESRDLNDRLYNLEQDPGEHHDQGKFHTDELSALAAELQNLTETSSRFSESRHVETEEIEGLKALGYLR